MSGEVFGRLDAYYFCHGNFLACNECIICVWRSFWHVKIVFCLVEEIFLAKHISKYCFFHSSVVNSPQSSLVAIF